MPRTKRILVDNGYYHIVTRGIDRRKLFRYNQDYKYFLKVIRKYLAKFKIYIINYCLMPNHMHLLVLTENSQDLPKFMQAILQVYASYLRAKYHYIGFIFQNRYKSKIIDNDGYLLECARYIERNPLRAKITDSLWNYPWSSFSFYAKANRDSIVNMTNPLFSELAEIEQEREQKYIKYVSSERPYDHIVDKEFRIK